MRRQLVQTTIAISILAYASTVSAQNSVVGVVRDATGRLVANAQVDSSSNGASWARVATTDEHGAFKFRGVERRLYLRFTGSSIDTLIVAVDASSGHGQRVLVHPADRSMLAASPGLQVSIRSLPSSRFFNYSEPNYFITGFDGERDSVDKYLEQVKFRVALRYRLSTLTGQYDSGIYLLFVQNSFWNILAQSAPFWDNNYNPGVMLYYDGREQGRLARSLRLPRKLSLGVAAEHESNGRDGDRSRSWNRMVMRGDWGDDEEDLVVVRAKAWHVLSLDVTNNPDLVARAGRGELVAELRPLRDADGTRSMGLLGLQVKSRVLGSQLINNVEASAFLYPSGVPVLRSLNSSLMLQYFRGRAENLVDYRVSREVIRVGIATVR